MRIGKEEGKLLMEVTANNNVEDKLSLDSLGEVLEELYEANTKWYNIGLRLGLQPSSLDRIRVSSTRDPADCFREMLKEWFKHCLQDCSWLALVRALRSTAVGEHSLARRLERKYCNRADSHERWTTPDGPPIVPRISEGDEDYSDMSASPMASSTSNSDLHSSNTTTSPTIEKGQKISPTFGCGCGRCSLNNFLDGRCPNPEKSLSSFPYLNTSGLKEADTMILKGRLFEEFCLISMEFSKFNTAICESLIDREIPVLKIARVLRDLRAFPASSSNAPLLGSRLPSITADKTIDDIFDILADYVSFFNFQITEHIVNNLGVENDRKLLCEYKKTLDEYCKRNLFECPSYSTPCHEETMLILKVEGIEKYNMKHLAKLISHVSRALSVSNHTLKLCCVEEGCVKLNFQVPQCVQSIFPLDEDKIGRLVNIGKVMGSPVYIILVKCGRWLCKLPIDPEKATQRQKVLEKGIYNHGILSRIDAELILHSVEYDCFLIRESMRHENDLVYSLKEQGQFLHILLEHKGEGSYGPHGQHEAYPNLEFFIKHVPKVPCFMPFLTEDNTRERISSHTFEDKATMSDYASDSDRDNTGDNTGEYTGTGDSAIALGYKLPSVQQSSFHLAADSRTEGRYQKLDMCNLDKSHTYTSIMRSETQEDHEI